MARAGAVHYNTAGGVYSVAKKKRDQTQVGAFFVAAVLPFS